MEELKKLGEQPENVQKVVDYLKTIHSVRNSTDEHQVARLIEQHHLGKQQVLPALLNLKEVKKLNLSSQLNKTIKIINKRNISNFTAPDGHFDN